MIAQAAWVVSSSQHYPIVRHPALLPPINMALVAGEPAEDISPPEDDSICTEDHCLYAFDTLYCSLTGETPIKVRFPNEK